MTSYPAQIDNSISLPVVIDNLSSVQGTTVNRLRTAILAIEQELGVNPSGIYSTVKSRLDTVETTVSNNLIMLDGDLGGTLATPLVVGLQGRLLSNVTPLIGQFLFWDGLVWRPSYSQSQAVISGSDVQFIAGTQLVNSETPYSIGARNLDMSLYPTTISDGRIRALIFHIDAEVSVGGVDGYAHLFDLTNSVIVTDTEFHFTDIITQEFSSTELTVGPSAGNIRDDGVTMYEMRIWKVSDAGADRAICHNARLSIFYT